MVTRLVGRIKVFLDVEAINTIHEILYFFIQEQCL